LSGGTEENCENKSEFPVSRLGFEPENSGAEAKDFLKKENKNILT
jgi:hypothetical protein